MDVAVVLGVTVLISWNSSVALEDQDQVGVNVETWESNVKNAEENSFLYYCSSAWHLLVCKYL